jgi:hypothetical protein
MKDMKGVLHDLAHQQAGAVPGEVNNPTGKRTGQNAVVRITDHTYFNGEKINQAG